MYAELRVAYLKKGFSMGRLVEKLNERGVKMDVSGLSNRLRGKVKFSEDEIMHICIILNADPRELFFNLRLLK